MCELCTPTETSLLHPLMARLDVMIGMNQRLLDVIREAVGVPDQLPVSFYQVSPAANTLYKAPQCSTFGIVDKLVVCGNGTVTLGIQDPHLAGTQTIIWQGPVNGTPLMLPFRVRMEPLSNFSITTDSNTGVALSLSYLIQPIRMTANDEFTFRRGL